MFNIESVLSLSISLLIDHVDLVPKCLHVSNQVFKLVHLPHHHDDASYDSDLSLRLFLDMMFCLRTSLAIISEITICYGVHLA